ncbi:hypothetical protein L916_08933 [Phytophthora nicotianae]|uniref:BZIP domain-containing protein n=1 Tax=Phytophthora nicotianae TaxID=4792 RepID=W2J1V6_PHYNI|nr:hypothetical protein L916_08933 [Phytophthora nicotianae]
MKVRKSPGPLHAEEPTERERHRLNEQRRRKKRINLEVKLKNDFCQLQREIKILECKRCAVLLRTRATDIVWEVAAEYFRLFHHGLHSNGHDTVAALTPCVQLDFVPETMSSDVVHNSGRGAEAMMKSWHSFLNWFEKTSRSSLNA